jgi:hypothetical protein
MRAWMALGVAALIGAGAAHEAMAQPDDALRWVYRELAGTWQSEAAPSRTSFQHQGAGVFRVHSNEASALLSRWNGRQVRAAGPVRTDAEGWTLFSLESVPARIGRLSGGGKVLELAYGEEARRVVLRQAPRPGP